MTDMEGVAGVASFEDFTRPEGRYHEVGRQLTTGEVNAAVEAAVIAGASEILVVDGHGAGAIDPLLLHPAAQVLLKPSGYPFGLDESFDCALIIGQHAKAGTADGHLWHTQNEKWVDCTINGVSVGEAGQNMLMCSEYGVPVVALSGDEACCREARALVPEIATAAVKRGLNRRSAIHLHHEQARNLIRAAVQDGIRRREEMSRFWLQPPYEMVVTWQEAEGAVKRGVKHGDSIVAVFNAGYEQVAVVDSSDAG